MQSIRQYRRLGQEAQRQLRDLGVESEGKLAEGKGEEVARSLEGVQVRERNAEQGKDDLVFVVGWDNEEDVLEPHNWPMPRRLVALTTVTLIAMSVTATSSIEAVVTPQASRFFHVSETAGSLTTGESPSISLVYTN